MEGERGERGENADNNDGSSRMLKRHKAHSFVYTPVSLNALFDPYHSRS